MDSCNITNTREIKNTVAHVKIRVDFAVHGDNIGRKIVFDSENVSTVESGLRPAALLSFVEMT